MLAQVCGDPTVDWLIVQDENHVVGGGVRRPPADERASMARLSSQAGGSVLSLQLLREMIPPDLAEVAAIMMGKLIVGSSRA